MLVLIAPTGEEGILKAYLARTKIIAFSYKRPNVLAKCGETRGQVSVLSFVLTATGF